MRKAGFTLSLLLLAVALTPGAVAEDERFAIRFGIILLQPTAEVEIDSETYDAGRSFGVEFDFEWYALPRLGLEASFAVALDSNIESEIDAAVGVTYTPLTLGLNGHIIRTRTLDWSVGVVGGVIWFTDFDFRNLEDDPVASSDTVRETTYGAQTSLDIGFGERARWGMNFGIKWLDADFNLDALPEPIPLDPLIVRVMGLYRW